jgi:hypothetical protein
VDWIAFTNPHPYGGGTPFPSSPTTHQANAADYVAMNMGRGVIHTFHDYMVSITSWCAPNPPTFPTGYKSDGTPGRFAQSGSFAAQYQPYSYTNDAGARADVQTLLSPHLSFISSCSYFGLMIEEFGSDTIVTTTIRGASQTFPLSSASVASTTSLANSGTVTITGVTGPVTYTGTAAGNVLTGCSGGTGTPADGAAVAQTDANESAYASDRKAAYATASAVGHLWFDYDQADLNSNGWSARLGSGGPLRPGVTSWLTAP